MKNNTCYTAFKGFDSYEELKVAEHLVDDTEMFNLISKLAKEMSFNQIAQIIGSCNMVTQPDKIKVTAEIVRKLLNSDYSKVFI
jgi:hypothetical protein|tara:strand:- start:526 stop:777 length:252 start_codon:yes stop_codon:yes gene_type:complete